MKKLKEKLNKQGGFTLIEMLIVVAIIAILIAIAIPMINKALERAREATDQANERAALGMAMTEVLATYTLADQPISGNTAAYYQVTNNKGTLVQTKPSAGFDYGKGTVAGDISSNNARRGIKIIYKEAAGGSPSATYDDFDIEWEAP